MYNMNNFKELDPNSKYSNYQSRQMTLAENTELLDYIGYSDKLLIYGWTNYVLFDCAPLKATLITSDFSYYQSNYSNFDYVYFYNVESIIMEDEWKAQFGYLFANIDSITDHSIYKIEYDGGYVKLKYIATIG
ncbi:hypothetical protein SDC9_187892 [bioreactor metagenome]|uniref:Uncharacterized protein n=1 Tax=bioreactor metagenome TaxID=1076179 RepID=A0A645HP51_9ZZZZ